MWGKINFTKSDGSHIDYKEMLSLARNHISENYATQLASHDDKDGSLQKQYLNRYLKSARISVDCNIDEAVNMLYEDMAGISFLSKYLNHIDQYPTLEEINFNSWNTAVAKFTDKGDVWLQESFISPQQAEDIIRRIIQKNNGILDMSTPGQISYINDQIRITAIIPPLIPKGIGVVASIRIVRGKINEDNYVSIETISAEMLEFLNACVKYGIPILIGGKPGAGKTTLLNYLLSKIPNDKRIISIEEGSRELNVTQIDASGHMVNQVISMLTSPNDKDEFNYDSSKLLEFALRLDGDYIVPQEMRSKETYVAKNATNTGSCVLATIHTSGAEMTYSRIVSLMQEVSQQDENVLMRDSVEAFPVIVFMAKLPDKKRRVMEILEGERFSKDDGLICRSLFQYVVEDNKENDDNTISVFGSYQKNIGISEKMKRRMINNGTPKALVERFAGGN